jgi:phage baseplate assembly protein W
VTPRSTAEVELLTRRLGTDLALRYAGPSGRFEDADLGPVLTTGVPPLADLATVSGVDAAVQMLVDRLQTQQGELAALGHPEYGSRHHELVGQPNTPRTRNLIKLYVLQALAQEPRVQRVLRVEVTAPDPARDTVRIDAAVALLDRDTPLNLVVPFSLGLGG